MIKPLFQIRSARLASVLSMSWLGLLLAIFLMIAESSVVAQRPGGGRFGGDGGRPPGGGRTFGGGGPRGFSGASTIFTLMNEDAQKDLGLTESDLEKIRSIQGKMRDPSMFDKLRNAKTDEERDAARAEMQSLIEKRNQEAEQEISKLIGDEKMSRLQQISLQFQGPRALQNEEIVKDLNLTSDQQAKIEALNGQRNDARRELGFRASAEERAAFDAEWNKKIFAVLTPDQSKAWEGKIGNVIVRSAIPGGGGTRFIGQSNSRFSSNQSQITTDLGSQTIRPDGESEEMISSFGLIAQNTPQYSNLVNRAETEATTAESAPAAQTKAENKSDVIGFGELTQSTTQKVSFNFRFAPWNDVLKQFAKISGLTLDLTTSVPGTFNYLDNGQYTPLEALDIINGTLIQKGYILVRRNQFLVVLNMDNGIPPNLIPLVTPEEVQKRGRYEIMKVRIPLKGISVDEAARTVEALLGPQGQIVPLSTAKELLVTDIGDNLRAISQLIDSIAKEDPNEVIQQTFKIEFVSVTEVEGHVRDLLGLPRGVANVAAFTGNDRDRRSSSQAAVASASGGITVIAHGKTNSLIVQTTRGQMKFVESLIKAIDVGDQRFAGGSVDTTPYLKVYIIQNAQATEIAKSLSALYPGLIVNEDGRARKLHIVATEEEHARIAADIKEMDRTDGDGAVLVFYLNKLDPIGAASTLNSLFIADGQNAPVIEPDTFSRLLLIRGTYEHIQQIKLVLNQLGESGEMGQQDTGRGRVRVFNAGGRDAAQILELMQRNWTQSSPNPIKIVVPAAKNPVKGEFTPSRVEDSVSSTTRTREVRTTSSSIQSYEEQLARDLERLFNVSNTDSADQALQELEDRDANEASRQESETDKALLDELERRLENAASPQPAIAPSTSTEDSPISIIVNGDEWIITSEDEKALDQLEQLLREIGMAMPPQNSWTLFYLQTADATEAAYMLEQLIPDSSVSSTSYGSDDSLLGGLTSSLFGIGSQVADASGLSSLGPAASTSLRIIPDLRMNALFVSGPSNQVREVEQFLKILDASELPESLRDRLPRQISVEHADVNDVFAQVSDLYQDYLNSGNASGGRGGNNNNIAAMLLGGAGGGGNSRNNRPQLAKLTLAVDEKTSHLIVSASDALFREIEATVKDIDKRALEAQPVTQVVRLEAADPLMVQQTLISLLPKVQISPTPSTRSSRSGGDNNNNNQPGGNNDNNRGNNDQNDAIRRAMEQRIREGAQQRNGGGGTGRTFSPFGGGGGRPSSGGSDGGRRSGRGR